VVADRLLRPGEHDGPAVTIALTLVASLESMLGGAEPGQVDGLLVPAEQVRELGYTFGLMPRPAPQVDDLPATQPAAAQTPETPPALERSTAPEPLAQAELPNPPAQAELPNPPTPVEDRPLAEWMSLFRARDEAAVATGLVGAREAVLDGTWTDGELRDVLDLGALMGVRELAGTGLAHRPQIAIVDRLRGHLVALTDATAIRRGQALGPPPDSDGYSPGAELDRFVQLRDRRCRFPGCRARARTCDLDHRREWPDGPTSHDNLALSFPRFLGVPDAWSGGQAERGPPMPRSPLKYPLEVRQRAVDMVENSGRPIASVAQELGLNPETLRKWVKAKQAAGKVPADELATPAEKDAEIRRLRAEVAELRRTNEILRLASAYFAQELGPARRSETSR
jgi:transposase-like protein